MKAIVLAFAVFLGSACYAQTKPSSEAAASPCLIIKLASGGSAFVHNANWEYVAGDFPKGEKFKGHITDRGIRKIKEKGGRVVVIRRDYTAEDLTQAQKVCSEP